jgi:hypothetical protein
VHTSIENKNISFQGLMMVNVQTVVFWVVTMCGISWIPMFQKNMLPPSSWMLSGAKMWSGYRDRLKGRWSIRSTGGDKGSFLLLHFLITVSYWPRLSPLPLPQICVTAFLATYLHLPPTHFYHEDGGSMFFQNVGILFFFWYLPTMPHGVTTQKTTI